MLPDAHFLSFNPSLPFLLLLLVQLAPCDLHSFSRFSLLLQRLSRRDLFQDSRPLRSGASRMGIFAAFHDNISHIS